MLENSAQNLHISTMRLNSKGEIFLSLTNQHQIWKITQKNKPKLVAGYIKPLKPVMNINQNLRYKRVLEM